jgi:hypothetical protein
MDDATYAALWSRWKEGDDGEAGIIRRLLGLPPKSGPLNQLRSEPGYIDKRTGTEFRKGFEIFRTFKGANYRAVADGGIWRLQDGRTAPSLNALSAVVGAPTENAWTGWRYKDGKDVKLIDKLRNPKKVGRRYSTQTTKTAEELGL